MSARQKLNSAAVTGALVIAGLVGLLAESLVAFLIAAAVLLVSSLYVGGIRPGRRKR